MKRTTFPYARACAAVLGIFLFFSDTAARAALCDADELIPLGSAAGISLSTEGVLVVGLSGVARGDETLYPARDAGIEEGDLILSIDGAPIRAAEDLQKSMERAGDEIAVGIRRGGEELDLTVSPVRLPDGSARIGVWIRDNMLGIGTLTFYDPSSGMYGALGHGINEKNSGGLLKIAGGRLMRSGISGVKRGEPGTPGELQGSFEPEEEIGDVQVNTPAGIFGKLHTQPGGRALRVAGENEVKLGDAKILTCVEGGEAKEYAIRICALYHGSDGGNRDLLIEVTDRALLDRTGGIVQGMSGSPILQNGAIVGAVTHVLVNNPRRGYGILIGNMLSACSEESGTALSGLPAAA